MLTSSSITGGTGNSFTANGVVTSPSVATSSVGGGIELGAGITTSQLSTALSKPSGTVPASGTLGSNVTILDPTQNAHTSGVVNTDISAGSVNLSNGGYAATLQLNGGAMQFDAVGSSNSISLKGATFTVNALKPIAYTTSVQDDAEAASDYAASNDNDNDNWQELARLLTPGEQSCQVLVTGGSAGGASSTQRISCVDDSIAAKAGHRRVRSSEAGKRPVDLTLGSGELFINPSCAMTIKTNYGELRVKKEALLSVSIDKRGMQVTVCSGPGDVVAVSGERSIALSPGQELLISRRSLTEQEAENAGEIGRRAFSSYEFGNGMHATICDVSLAGVIARLDKQHAVVHSKDESMRRIAERLLKTAVVVQQVTNSRGAYRAAPAQSLMATDSRLIPIGYVEHPVY